MDVNPPDDSTGPDPGRFPTTHWSRVAAACATADPGSREALEGLCRDYWYPLYALIRRKGHGPDEAADLVQGFLADLLERGDLAAADRARGRLRSFLSTACVHFLANRRDHDRARKRGGGRVPVPIDALRAEGRYGAEPADALTPERLFERRWALTLLDRALSSVADEEARAGRSGLFERLRAVLTDEPGASSYAALARELGVGESAMRTAALRLRRRFREALRAEVALTVNDPAAVDDELAALFEALSA
jgi:RNA polymerase sigma-70 factor (ECF subfamily)